MNIKNKHAQNNKTSSFYIPWEVSNTQQHCYTVKNIDALLKTVHINLKSKKFLKFFNKTDRMNGKFIGFHIKTTPEFVLNDDVVIESETLLLKAISDENINTKAWQSNVDIEKNQLIISANDIINPISLTNFKKAHRGDLEIILLKKVNKSFDNIKNNYLKWIEECNQNSKSLNSTRQEKQYSVCKLSVHLKKIFNRKKQKK